MLTIKKYINENLAKRDRQCYNSFCKSFAGLAQLVEQRIRNA